jgi:hypothetical protein
MTHGFPQQVGAAADFFGEIPPHLADFPHAFAGRCPGEKLRLTFATKPVEA